MDANISPNGRPYSDIDRELELIPAADLPFNLAGESQSSELTAEAEARVRALAESEARKAQYVIDFPPVERAMRGESFPLDD